MLILTKFAELVMNPANPVYCLGMERFVAMTRLSVKTIDRHLDKLEECGFLVCIEKPKGKRPKFYKLNLPEGFNRETVAKRRRKFYGGVPLLPGFQRRRLPVALPLD